MSSGDVGRPGWHKPVLVLAVLLVVGQIVAFVVLRKGKGDERKSDPDSAAVATNTQHDAAPEAPPTPPTIAETPTTPTVVEPPAIVDAGVETATIDAAIEEPAPRPTTTEKRKPSRAETLAQLKREREEKKRDEDERRRIEQERERKRLEADRAAEQAKLAAEIEKKKLEAQKAEADALAAKAAADRARLEAAATKPATPVTPAQPAGPDVLVLVLGPGTPSVSSDQIRNVYLGRTSVWPNGSTARPINRPAATTAAKKFYGGILRMNAGAFSEHWSEIQLGGGGIAPPTVSSGKVTVAKVAATSGGFGYVMESELPDNTNGVRLVRLK